MKARRFRKLLLRTVLLHPYPGAVMSGDCRRWKWAGDGNTWRGESFLLLKDDLATGAVPSESKFLGGKSCCLRPGYSCVPAKCPTRLCLQLCPTLWDPIECSPPGSSVHGVLQARILEWVAMPLSRGSSRPRGQTWVSCVAGRFFTL